MEKASEIADKINSAEKAEFNELYGRMDEEFERWDMSPEPVSAYSGSIRSKTKAHGSDIEVVSNDLRAFSDNVQSTLASAEMQIMVRMAEAEGEDKRDEIAMLERLFLFALEQGDMRLRRLLLPPLRESEIWYSSIRGWAAGRFLVYKSGKNVIFDFMPWDPRWVTYEVGGNGLLWVGYKTFKSKSALKSEYDYDASKERNNLVLDYWKFEEEGKISNGVICEDTFLKEPETYNMSSMPILIMPVSIRPPIATSEGIALKGYGESIFAPARNINALRNRFASIVANHANLMANQALINYRTGQGIDITSTTNVPGGVLNLPMGENKLEPSPMQEISPTVVNMLGWLNGQMEQAMLPKIPIGEPPPSGTMYNLAQEAGNRVFNPQLRNLNYFYADICRLIEEQVIAGGIKVKIKGIDKNEYYETQVAPVDLKRPHTIKVEFTARTPWTQLDTYQIADMAKRLGLPDAFIHEYILKLPDPKGLGDLSAIEMAEHSPKLAMLRAWVALKKAGRDDEADQLAEDMYNMARQEEEGMAPPVGGER